MLLFFPANDCIKIVVRHFVIAKNSEIDVGLERVNHTLGRLKIHVGNPHRKQVKRAVEALVEPVPLSGIGVLSIFINYLVRQRKNPSLLIRKTEDTA